MGYFKFWQNTKSMRESFYLKNIFVQKWHVVGYIQKHILFLETYNKFYCLGARREKVCWLEILSAYILIYVSLALNR